jgi:hypothetical protein
MTFGAIFRLSRGVAGGFCTVIIFLARNGRTRAVKFRPKNFGRISFDLGEIRPIFLRANLKLRGFAHFEQVSPKKNYCVGEYCIDTSSAVSSARKLKFWFPASFGPTWCTCSLHLILRIEIWDP